MTAVTARQLTVITLTAAGALNLYLLYDTAASQSVTPSGVSVLAVLEAVFPGLAETMQPSPPPDQPVAGTRPIAVSGGS